MAARHPASDASHLPARDPGPASTPSSTPAPVMFAPLAAALLVVQLLYLQAVLRGLLD